MIWHFLEVWGVLLVAFAAGCMLGTLLYMGLAASPLARLQVAAADAIGGAAGGLRWRFGSSGDDRVVALGRAAPESRLLESDRAPAVGLAGSRIAEWPDEAEPIDEDGGPISAGLDEEDFDRESEGYWEGEAEEPVEAYSAPAAGTTEASPARRSPTPELPAMRPLTLPGPRNGVPDNLQRIRGIGQKNEELLNSLGIYHFGQIAAWTPAEARWVAGHLAFPERLDRDDWVGQAIILATGGDTGYVKAAERRRSRDETPSEDAAP